MKSNGFDQLILFLQDLQKQAIDYSLAHHRDEAMMVIVSVPRNGGKLNF